VLTTSDLCVVVGLTTLAAARCVAEGAPTDSPEAVPPKIREIHVEKVGALTGPEALLTTKPLDICGTDLGTMTEVGNRIFFAFGDTFGYDGDICRGVGGPNWRSNAFASTTDHDPANGVALGDWLRRSDGKAIAVVEGAHQPPFTGDGGEQPKIPTAMVSVGNRIYLHYMSVHGFSAAGGVWDCNYSKFVYSDDLGKTWEQSEFNLGERDSNFNMLALTNEQGRGNEERTFIYALGTPCTRSFTERL
jgi:D-arabinan endo alpha-(1,5)-arabinofuranosidase